MIWIFKTICIFYDFPYKTVINHNLWFNSSWSCSKCLLFGKKGSYHFSLSSEYSKLWFLPIIFKLFTIFSYLMSQRAVKEWMIANCTYKLLNRGFLFSTAYTLLPSAISWLSKCDPEIFLFDFGTFGEFLYFIELVMRFAYLYSSQFQILTDNFQV